MFDKEQISKEFCFWLADSLRLGYLTKDEAEQFALAFKVGLTRSDNLDGLTGYLEGVAQSFPNASELIDRLKNNNQKVVNSQNKDTIIEFAQKFIGDPEIVSFLEQANKDSDIEKLANQFPKFGEYLKSINFKINN